MTNQQLIALLQKQSPDATATFYDSKSGKSLTLEHVESRSLHGKPVVIVGDQSLETKIAVTKALEEAAKKQPPRRNSDDSLRRLFFGD